MTHRSLSRGLVALALAALAFPSVAGRGVAVAAPLEGYGEVTLGTTLTGSRVPGGDPDGFGGVQLTVALDLTTSASPVCSRLTTAGITLRGARAAVHRGPIGVDGPAVFELTPPDAAGRAAACGSMPNPLAVELVQFPQRFHVTVTTADFPGGALRGNLSDLRAEGDLFAAPLAPEPSDGQPGAAGVATVTTDGVRLCWTVAVTGVPDATGARLHAGAPGTDGPVVAVLDPPAPGGCRNDTDRQVLADLIAHPDRYAVSIPTVGRPAGALGGTLARMAAPAGLSPQLTISSFANIWGAGHAFAPGGGEVPPAVPVAVVAGNRISVEAISGQVRANGGWPWNGPDGGHLGSGTDIASTAGISGIRSFTGGHHHLFLVGVFVGPEEPRNPAPPILDFTGNVDFAELAPLPRQIFFVGDGRTATGAVQHFIVPPGATRLHLGFADAFDFVGTSGSWWDNGGQFLARIRSAPPATW